MVTEDQIVIYGGTRNHDFDARVLELVNASTGKSFQFSHVWHSIWTDGEPGFRLEDPALIKGRHAVIFSCPTNFKIASELNDMVVACKQQYGAKSVTVVLSFLRYRRQDRPEHDFEITRLRWFMRDLKMLGVDNLVVCEPHSVENTVKYAKEFGINLVIADPTPIYVSVFKEFVQAHGGPEKVMIYSPDFGSIERSIPLATALGLKVLVTPKKRSNGEVKTIESEEFLHTVREYFGADAPVICDRAAAKGMHLIMREDELDSGGTAVTTRRTFGNEVAGFHFVATHPVCSRGWKMKLFPHGQTAPFDTVWLGNTRPRGDGETRYEGSSGNRVKHIDVEACVADALLKVLKTL